MTNTTISQDVMSLISELDAQYAGAWPGDPNDTYNKILSLCNHNMDLVAAHFEAADMEPELYGAGDAPQGRRSN